MNYSLAHLGLVPVAVHFETVRKSCRYSRIAGKLMKRKYLDPYPLPHVSVQIKTIGIALVYGYLRHYPYQKSDETLFSYLWHVTAQSASNMLSRYQTLEESFKPFTSVTEYWSMERPWCTDIAQSILFGSEDIKHVPPFEYLDYLCSREGGYLLNGYLQSP